MNKTNETNNTYEKGTIGESIALLVKEHTGTTAGEYILERAFAEVKSNNKLLKNYKNSLFAKEVSR